MANEAQETLIAALPLSNEHAQLSYTNTIDLPQEDPFRQCPSVIGLHADWHEDLDADGP